MRAPALSGRAARRDWYGPTQGLLAAGLLGAFLVAGTASVSAAEDMQLMACAPGRPQYCLKYGQGQCLKKNSQANAASACEQWTQACVECQTAIAYCFERSPERILDGSAECTACQAELTACMASVDKEFWPNR